MFGVGERKDEVRWPWSSTFPDKATACLRRLRPHAKTWYSIHFWQLQLSQERSRAQARLQAEISIGRYRRRHLLAMAIATLILTLGRVPDFHLPMTRLRVPAEDATSRAFEGQVNGGSDGFLVAVR